MHFPVAAGIDEDGGPGVERHLGVGVGGLDGAVLAQERADAGHGHHQFVSELVEPSLDPEVAAEGQREGDAVGAGVATRVVANEQDGPLVGDVVQTPDLGPVPQRGEQPCGRQGVPDVVGITVVEQLGESLRLCTRHRYVDTRCSPVYTFIVGPRRKPTSVMPASSASSTARLEGAETDASTGMPAISAF